MKKIFTLIICANLIIYSSTLSADSALIPAELNLETAQKSVITTQNSNNDITTFITAHKKELAILAIAITIGLSLKYCSYIQGIVGIDTEDEIDDWRVFIQK